MTNLVWVSLNKIFFLEFLDDFSNVLMYKNEGGILDFLAKLENIGFGRWKKLKYEGNNY